MNDEFYVSLIGEVFDGYTECVFRDAPIYIKHFSIRDQRYIQKYYEKHKNLAVNRGVETEEQILKRLKEDDIWSEADDVKIDSLSFEIKNLKATQKNLFIPSQREKMQKDINEKQREIITLESKRKEVVGRTAEDYASSRAAEEMLRYFIYEDPELKNLKFSQEEFDDIEDYELLNINTQQMEISNRLSEENLQRAVLRPFFSMYLSLCENVNGFYGKSVTMLSAYQLKTVMFGRMFYNIFQYTDNIPENIKDDPEKLLSFSEAQRNKDSGKKFIKDDADATAIFGATKEDMESLSSDSGGKAVSLSEELKKAGGKLNMEQMIKLSGR